MGSLPLVLPNRACTSAGVMLQAAEETWQLLQVRPLVPRLWKNGLVMSTGPEVPKVLRLPVGSEVVSGFDSEVPPSKREAAKITTANPTTTNSLFDFINSPAGQRDSA